MKISKQDEYGLRLMLQIAKATPEIGLSIPQLSDLENMSQPYVGKITRVLRIAGLIESTRGQKGGYVLARSPELINIKEIIDALGGNFYDQDYCATHNGQMNICTHSVDCSLRSLWKILQFSVDKVLENLSLADLRGTENSIPQKIGIENILEDIALGK